MSSIQAQTVDTFKTLSGIRIVGLKKLTDNALPTTFNVQENQRVLEKMVLLDVQKLYLTGYFQEVSAYTIPATDNTVTLVFQVTENPTVRATQFSGNTRFSENKLREIAAIPEGILNTQGLSDAIKRLTALYHESGYELAQINRAQLTDAGVVQITISEGEISQVTFYGLGTLPAFIFLRDMHSQPGTILNTRTLREDRDYLIRQGFLGDVAPPRLGESLDRQRVNIAMDVQERKFRHLDIGAEQEEKLPLVAYVRGDLYHTLIPSDHFSGKVQMNINEGSFRGYALRYTQPWLLNLIPISLDIGWWSEVRQEFLTKEAQMENRSLHDITRSGADIGFGWQVIRNTLTLSTRFRDERVTPKSSNLSAYEIRALSLGVLWRTYQNMYNPKNGFSWSVDAEKGGEFGGLSFYRITTNTAIFLGLWDGLTWGTRFLGGIFEPQSTTDTFDAEGYQVGGSMSLRGYKDNTPPFVGNKELLLNVELRQDVTDTLQVVGFFDIGKAFSNNWADNPISTFKHGYGIGLRVFTPLGPIRFDSAWGEAWILHFGLGQVF